MGASKKSKRGRGRDASPPPRPEGRIYQLTPEVQSLLKEVKRLFPRSRELVQFGALPPGCESVETVSQQLLSDLRKSFDQERFMVFCRLNAERVLDCIQHRIDEGAWPLDPQELLAEVYFRLHDELLFRAGVLPSRRTAYPWTEASGPAGTYEMLRLAVDALLDEQLRLLRARTIPLPGIPKPTVSAADPLIDQADDYLSGRGCRLERKTLLDWIAHALMRLPAPDRRVLHQREVLRRGLREIAAEFKTTPFQVGLLLRQARLKLHDELTTLLAIFQGERAVHASRSDESKLPNYAGGRLVYGPWASRRRATGEVTRIEIRTDLGLARVISRIASAVMHRDANYHDYIYSNTEHVVTCDIDADARDLITAIREAHVTVEQSHESANNTARSRSRVLCAIADSLERLQPTRQPHEIARELVARALEISPNCSAAWQVRGNISWFHDPESDVVPSFEHALQTAANPTETALALSNLAVCDVDNGNIVAALSKSAASLQARVTELCLVNRMIWCRFLGLDAEADKFLRVLTRSALNTMTARMLRPHVIRRRANMLARVFDIPNAKKERITATVFASTAIFRGN